MSSLDSQALSRKERLAQLRNLKRKRADDAGVEKKELEHDSNNDEVSQETPEESTSTPSSYLSKRNYDPEARAPKQGFFEPPTTTAPTVEEEAKRIENELAEKEPSPKVVEGDDEDTSKPELDVTSLRPRSANWDIKRQISDKLEILQRQTDVAINRIVRERVRSASPGAGDIPAGVDLNRAMDKMEPNGAS
ncbi:mRNA splicing factor [Kockiozyma suomiensis]|uniref:mRNA splicing factor n=1 Tax=Kockiozyma suomiensis TaxID=1337062 RepID=UPI0033430856